MDPTTMDSVPSTSPDWLQYGRPTIDRPFGLQLWPIFDRAFRLFRPYGPDEFEYIRGKTMGSTLFWTVFILTSYYVVIFGGREIMKKHAPFKLSLPFKIHNLFLTIISLGLLLLFMEQMIPTIWRHGWFYSICNEKGGWTPQLVTLYYLNYMTKYIELLDTVFLFLKKKPLIFLHTYHHGATALLCWTQMSGRTSVSWIVISLNLAVHVVMYWYYFLSACGYRPWWKKYITRMQITQFVIDLGFVFFAAYNYFADQYRPNLPHTGSCNGEEFAALSGVFILSSYLFLFIGFYVETYRRKVSTARRLSAAAALSAASKEIGASTAVSASANDNSASELKRRA